MDVDEPREHDRPTERGRARRRRSAARFALTLALAVVAALAAAELALRLRPRLLPDWYRARFPMHGVELDHPGILDETPVEGVPLPVGVGTRTGAPPADLRMLGLVPADVDTDVRELPEVHVPADALGFPNAVVPARADIVLVGDSFVVAMGALRPRGLQASLAEALGLTVYNAGVVGVGPVREAWIVERVALPLRPRCVLWFWFGGNDVLDVVAPLAHLREGRATWGEVHAGLRPPPLRTLGLLRAWLGRERTVRPAGGPLPAFELPLADGGVRETWLAPAEMRQLLWSDVEWTASPSWAAACDALRRARDATEAAGARLRVVYLPSKAEVLLPHVAPDPDLVRRTASFGLGEPLIGSADALLERMLARRGVQEELLAAFCRAEGIPFLSARPALEARVASGRSAFLAADTHWHGGGQEALLEPLLAFLAEQGLAESR